MPFALYVFLKIKQHKFLKNIIKREDLCLSSTTHCFFTLEYGINF